MYTEHGYMSFKGIDCCFYEGAECFTLITKDEQSYSRIMDAVNGPKEPIAYSTRTDKCCTLVYQEAHNDFEAIYLVPKYVVRVLENKFSSIVLTGETIDAFFSPIRYFYRKRVAKQEYVADLLYSQQMVDQWDITFNSQIIHVEFSYGNILQNGVASDLRLHPRIRMTFQQTSDPTVLYKVYQIIRRFLQIVFYISDCGKVNVEVYGGENGQSFLGYLHDYQVNEKLKYRDDSRLINYSSYRDYVAQLLQFAADNPNLIFDHYPEYGIRIDKSDYSPALAFDVFSAFERECSENPTLYEKTNDAEFQPIKDTIIRMLDEIEPICQMESEKWFVQEARGRIQQLGTQIGQANKVKKAYEVLSETVDSSIENILWRWHFTNPSHLDESEIKRISKLLSRIRGKKAHGNAMEELSEEEVQAIRLLELINYTQMLLRAGISNADAAMISGAVFYSNQLLLEREMKLLHALKAPNSCAAGETENK